MRAAVLASRQVPEGRRKLTITSLPAVLSQGATSGSLVAGLPLFVQPKLAVSQPGDPYEQEADRVAEQVLCIPESKSNGVVPRKCAAWIGGGSCSGGDNQSAGPIHRNLSEGAKAAVDRAASGKGEPLQADLRDQFEAGLGADLSSVRLHTGSESSEAAQAVRAKAYTVGNDVHFGAGQYDPSSRNGQFLIAHEVAHTVQQGRPGFVQRYSTQDCESDDVTRVDESHNRAIDLVKAAIARLTADPVTAETQAHFSNHFGGYGSWRRDIVVGHFTRDLKLLTDSEMTYECESECDEGEPAYTYWVFGDIHVCLPWLRSQVLTERGETFVHEMHHWDAGRGHLDLGYHKNNQDHHTTWIVAVNNADAYSELAQDLYEQP